MGWQANIDVFRRCMPVAIRSANFLSGGQSLADASARLSVMNKKKGHFPVSMSSVVKRVSADWLFLSDEEQKLPLSLITCSCVAQFTRLCQLILTLNPIIPTRPLNDSLLCCTCYPSYVNYPLLINPTLWSLLSLLGQSILLMVSGAADATLCAV
jgi:hypothetical protein